MNTECVGTVTYLHRFSMTHDSRCSLFACLALRNYNLVWTFVLRKKGRKTKKRMKEEEMEKGDCGPQDWSGAAPD